MLKLYYGRANVDKDGFMFDRIREQLNTIAGAENGKVLLIVPDQFTLQAERNAFEYLKVDGLMDIDILSFTRLGAKVLDQTGGTTRAHVDKYGRHMLLAQVAAMEEKNLTTFRGMSQKHSFLDLVNDLISEMKQFNIRPEDIGLIRAELPPESILYEKLGDVHRIYEKYEELICGKYVDTEDYLDLFISKIGQSAFVSGAEIWIDGFDYYTPKMMGIIKELVKAAGNVHIIMTLDSKESFTSEFSHRVSRDGDLFALQEKLCNKFKEMVMDNSFRLSEESIGSAYQIKEGTASGEKAAEIIHLEHELYAYPYQKYGPLTASSRGAAIEFCQCSNYYAETETVAVKIAELIRDQGMRYRDILVICNDMENRASIIRRIFREYELPCFIDQKRGILHNPCIEYISALMDILTGGWRYEDVFRLIKTGLTSLPVDAYEKLDNYAYKYRIKGNRWKSRFKFGIKDEGEEELTQLNQSRQTVVSLISDFEQKFLKAETVREKTVALYDFLTDTAEIPQRAEALTEYLRQNDALEYAEETEQIWDVIINILDQLVLLVGDSQLSAEAYFGLLKTGFEAVEIGILPPTADQIIVGTMQRTRSGPIKALFVIGANDGVLPAATMTEGLLSEDEKSVLLKRSIEICKSDDLRILEERLAIYRTLSKPTGYLWMGYSAADLEGKEIRQSLILDKLRKIFPKVPISKDILNREDPLLLVTAKDSTLRHMTEELRKGYETGSIDDVWKATYNWFRQDAKEETGRIKAYDAKMRGIKSGMLFDNKVDQLGLDYIKKLYGRGADLDLTLSPSRIERFSKCPFAYFINFGLKAEERLIFEVSGREMGDIYHDCLKRLSVELTMEGIEITSSESPWMQISREECDSKVERLVMESAELYKEGILDSGEAEQYRQERIKGVFRKTAWMMVEHVKAGLIKNSFFEADFGRAENALLPPIEIKVGDEKLFIEGKIDRIDVLGSSDSLAQNQDFLKIIDYKSGKEKFDLAEVRGGWRLQLMLYLRAAKNGLKSAPAGVFYFNIDDAIIDETIPQNASTEQLASAKENLAALVRKKFKMDGIVLDDPQVISGIAGEFYGSSDIIPISKNRDGGITSTSGKLLNLKEFDQLQETVDETVDKLCASLVSGVMDITPKRVKPDITACTYCPYKSICTFDLSFEGCKYINVN